MRTPYSLLLLLPLINAVSIKLQKRQVTVWKDAHGAVVRRSLMDIPGDIRRQAMSSHREAGNTWGRREGDQLATASESEIASSTMSSTIQGTLIAPVKLSIKVANTQQTVSEMTAAQATGSTLPRSTDESVHMESATFTSGTSAAAIPQSTSLSLTSANAWVYTMDVQLGPHGQSVPLLVRFESLSKCTC
jgi:hypothetical protein